MNVFELFATLGLDTSGYDEGLQNAESSASSFGSTIGSVISTGATVAGTALVATGTAIAGVTSAFASGISDVAEWGDTVDKQSQKMNISAESYQVWSEVMEHCGTSIDSMQTSMKTLATAVETGNEAFETLGFTQEELAEMNQEEIFEATITALQEVESDTERTYLASQLLGRGATELGALLNMSAEETQDLKDRVYELGGVMSDEAVKNSASYQDSIQDLGTAFEGLRNNLLGDFLPSITTVADGLTEIMIGNDNEGLGMIDEGVNSFVENLDSMLPRLMSVGTRIITSLITAISSNLPTLLSSGSSVISELLQGIISAIPYLAESAVLILGQITSVLMDNIGLLLNTALDLILYLADAFSENAPELIPAIVDVISQIVTTLTEPSTLSALISAVLQIILAISEGITNAIPEITALIPVIIGNVIVALGMAFPDLLSALLELTIDSIMQVFGAIAGLLGMGYDELQDGASNLLDGIGNWMADVIEFFVNLGTNIVSTVRTLWNNVTAFFANGFSNISTKVESGLNSVKSKFTSVFDNVKTTVQNAINFIKGLFNFEWSLPKIKLPHFSVSGSLDLLATPPKLPSVSISWYKKAMEQPYMLNGATIFGASGGSLLGGGESGSEIVIGTDKLMSMMRQAVGVGSKDIVINVYGAEGQDVRLLAKEVSKELQNLVDDKNKIFA